MKRSRPPAGARSSAWVGIELAPVAARAVVVDARGAVLGAAARAYGDAPSEAAQAAMSAALEAAGLDAVPRVGLAIPDPLPAPLAASGPAGFPRASRAGSVMCSPGAAVAVAEAWGGAARGARTVIALVLDDQAYAGVLLDGRVWKGAHGLAGSAAWLALNPVERQDYRTTGCLAAEASARGIARRLAWRVEAGDSSAAVERAGGRLENLTAAHVFESARAGDGVAISVVRDTARYIGMAIANLVAAVDPEVIVLGGVAAVARDLLLEPVRQEAARRMSPALGATLRIEACAFGLDAAAIGAARLAMLESA